MKLKIISTGSKGNCYLLENSTEALIIECGVKVSEVKKALNFDLSKISGAIVTHSHGDHAKYINEFVNSSINVHVSKETKDEINIKSHRIKTLEINKINQVGSFKILPFEVNHDVFCVGFIINHPECGNVLFLTDTYYSQYKFNNLNQIIIEANYSDTILDKKYNDGETIPLLRNRILESHLSLENCIDLCKANDLSKVNNIVLIHLSDSNSDENYFKQQMLGATNKNVHIASNGLEIDFNITAF